MLGKKIYKNHMDEYTECAVWANENNAMIVEKDGYYEVVPVPGPTLEEAKATKLEGLHTAFETKRDAVIWVPTSLGLYGFDTKEADRINFNDAWKAAEINGNTGYRVWLEQRTKEKGWREGFTVTDFNKIFEEGRKQQIAAYAWFEEIKAKIEAAETAEALETIEVK